MDKKSLIIYASQTGNTEKVAFSFKKAFENEGWKCDVLKVTKDTDFSKLPFDYKNYDFLCVGTPNTFKLPAEEINTFLYPPHPAPPVNMPNPQGPKSMPTPQGPTPVKPIKFSPDCKKGIVFATFSGVYLGPKEVEPVLSYMSVLMERNLEFQCVGKFSCPGKFSRHTGWYKDLDKRPDERDLQKAEIFMEETIEDNYLNGQ